LSALVIPGVLLLSGGLDVGMRMGLYVGILSSFLAAIFTTLNKREIDLHNPTPLNITFFNVVGALLVTSVALLWTRTSFEVWWPQSTDWGWLLVLSIGCTIVPQYW
jgi:drug/metabolite transporter (DMT)-like permease